MCQNWHILFFCFPLCDFGPNLSPSAIFTFFAPFTLYRCLSGSHGAEFRSVIRKKRLALALCGHFLYVEGNGEEGKVHSDLVFTEVPEPFVLHVCLHLPENRFRLCASFPPVPDSLLRCQPLSRISLVLV